MKKQYKLPTFLGLLLLLAGVGVGVTLIQRTQLLTLRASPGETPQQARVTNITDRSFSVSWTTEQKVNGFLAYGRSSSLGSVAQDQIADKEPEYLHHVTVQNLSPETTFFFKIGSGKSLYDNDGKPYQTTTAHVLPGAPETDIIFGEVKTEVGAGANLIVYVTLPNVSPLSAVTDEGGKWGLPLSVARSSDLSSFANYTDDTKVQIFVQAGQKFGSATILAGAAHPVPPITLGQNHDFTDLQPASSQEVPASTIELPPETPQPEEQSGGGSVTLSSPEDNEIVYTTKPLFLGSSTPGTKIKIIVESRNVFEAEVTVGEDGTWSWSPSGHLETGEHTITISWQDEAGNPRTITRTFMVLAAGQDSVLPSFTASPSGESTSGAEPSPTPTASPTATPRSSLPSTESGIPVSGNLTTTLSLLIMGSALALFGLFLPRVIKL